jgi:recombinational DNA repair protein RecT
MYGNLKTITMNKEKIKQELNKHESKYVSVYINYLAKLEAEKNREGKLKNLWFKHIQDQQFVDVFNKVAIDDLYIDGEIITLQYRGELLISYGYQAYRKLLLKKHPESKIDISLVHNGDNFSFKKDSGKVIYSHNINNPFDKNKEIIGCYCIIKNSLGENIEILDLEDIRKMRNSAKTDNVWKTWFSEMVLKSVLKRACKRYFFDTFKNVEASDNENYDLEQSEYDHKVKSEIESAGTVEELTKIYKKEINLVKDKNSLIDDITMRKEEIITEEFDNGVSIEDLKKKYNLTDEYCKKITND